MFIPITDGRNNYHEMGITQFISTGNKRNGKVTKQLDLFSLYPYTGNLPEKTRMTFMKGLAGERAEQLKKYYRDVKINVDDVCKHYIVLSSNRIYLDDETDAMIVA